jgi:hypothetical protein
MWPIQLAFLLSTVCMIFLSSLNLCNTSSFFTRSVQLIFSILLQHHIETFHVFLIYFSTCPSFSTVQSFALNVGLKYFAVYTRWLKYDRDKLWLVYTQSVPVIFEPPCRTSKVFLNIFLKSKWYPLCKYDSGVFHHYRRSVIWVESFLGPRRFVIYCEVRVLQCEGATRSTQALMFYFLFKMILMMSHGRIRFVHFLSGLDKP